MPKLKLSKAIKSEAQTFTKLQAEAKEKSNAANRQKTSLRNAIKDEWKRHSLPIGSYVRVAGMEIRYEANTTSSIDPERVMELYEKGEISREQFLRTLKINATEAKNVLGGDQVADFTVEDVGTALDIRIAQLPVENIDDEFIMEFEKVRKRVKRRVFGGKKPTESASAAIKPKTKRRKIKVKR